MLEIHPVERFIDTVAGLQKCWEVGCYYLVARGFIWDLHNELNRTISRSRLPRDIPLNGTASDLRKARRDLSLINLYVLPVSEILHAGSVAASKP